MINFFSTIQYEMESKYQEESMLTNLFIENKFWGWTGLSLILIMICLIIFFQFRSWEEGEE